ncbi:GFA family protein [Aurantimonas sp. VKM B-3413]|uniref:GFA family protein n=1 Tax=Aurantimonas sp. VKM B-3413 TaxID=2779401 RepID=UPI001E32305E|nr:GFA family protein [Aurantimonas sp. VKM B-3413]MCB8838234.1 GFA family protein [Aurantimonas sp. VKM B-3413]
MISGGTDAVHEASCRCGRVQIAARGRPLITMACHCTGCRKMTSSAFSLSALYPADALTITSGEPVIGGLHGPTRHYFCGWCMSWLFTRPEGMDDLVNIRSAMFDDAPAFPPYVETFTSESMPFVTAGAEHSFERFPPQDAFPELLAAYAQWTG